MSACNHDVPDYTFCLECLPIPGNLILWKKCGLCGARWHESTLPGGSATAYDVYDLTLASGPCRKCPEPPTRKTVEQVKRMTRLHSLWHWIQEDLGFRHCLNCKLLVSNRYRPMSHSVRGEVRR
jgi:hypothetical protein